MKLLRPAITAKSIDFFSLFRYSHPVPTSSRIAWQRYALKKKVKEIDGDSP